MMALWQKDKISVTELAVTVGLSKPTMTPLLKQLEVLDYTSREFELGDECQKCITLTEKGHTLVSEGGGVARQALCATGLSGQEAEQLILLCQKIKTNLD
jgi:DNA-binding MarR family transcriptional regulator